MTGPDLATPTNGAAAKNGAASEDGTAPDTAPPPMALRTLAAQVQALTDRAELADLADRYLRALDDSAFDEAWAHTVFTEDVELDFPPGSHQGIADVPGFTRGFMHHWQRTHHNVSHYAIELDGDRAAVAWNVVAIHLHHGSPPPPASAAHFYLGGRFEGVARRTAAGWRLSRLTLRVAWTTGPGIRSIAQVMTGTDGQQVIDTWKAGRA